MIDTVTSIAAIRNQIEAAGSLDRNREVQRALPNDAQLQSFKRDVLATTAHADRPAVQARFRKIKSLIKDTRENLNDGKKANKGSLKAGGEIVR